MKTKTMFGTKKWAERNENLIKGCVNNLHNAQSVLIVIDLC